MVYLLTGPVQSGKTTSLVNWSADRNDISGILTPVINGKRIFLNAATKEEFPMEAAADETTIITVGRFTFSKHNFEKASQVIREGISQPGWLIIDEIGPVELRREGFAAVLNESLSKKNEKILLVVREGLIQKVQEQFNITASIIGLQDLFRI